MDEKVAGRFEIAQPNVAQPRIVALVASNDGVCVTVNGFEVFLFAHGARDVRVIVNNPPDRFTAVTGLATIDGKVWMDRGNTRPC